MGKIYGYCRISTKQQNIDRQERNILAEYPAALIIKEVFTGTKLEGREKFDKLLKKVKTGDTIVFDSVSRMSRNAEDGFELYKKLFEKGVNIVFIKEAYINTDTYKQKVEANNTIQVEDEELNNTIMQGIRNYLLKLAEKQIKIAFDQAEQEVQDLRQRTREGIETARLNGKQIGQQKGRELVTKKSIQAKEQIQRYSKDFDGTLKDIDVMKLIGISRNSYYKYKKQLTEQKASII